MPKKNYIHDGHAAFARQLLTFKKAIGPYRTLLGLSIEQVASQAADADYSAHIVDTHTLLQNAANQWATWKGLNREDGSPPATAIPVFPVQSVDVPAVPCGVESRFRALVRLIKAQPAYNSSIGKALGIEGEEKGGPDFTTVKPKLTAAVTGGHVRLGWGWLGHRKQLDLIELQVDRGSGYGLLTFDSTPNYTDTAAFPTAPAKWSYKAIYRVGDQQVGQWSAEVSVTVGG